MDAACGTNGTGEKCIHDCGVEIENTENLGDLDVDGLYYKGF
jgi:hypothetical protein